MGSYQILYAPYDTLGMRQSDVTSEWTNTDRGKSDTKQRHEKANAFNKRQSVSKCNENVDNEKPKTIAEKMLKNRKGGMTEGVFFFILGRG